MTWPTDRPGYPMHAERDGWHWLKHPEDLRPFPSPWNAELGGWPSGALHSPQGIIDLGFTYLGPCLTPAEVAAAVQAEREACAATCSARITRWAAGHDAIDAGRTVAAASCADAIRARGDTFALDAALAQARREGMEKAARIADAEARHDQTGCNPAMIAPRVAAAIRSAAGEGGK